MESRNNTTSLLDRIQRIPEGYSIGNYRKRSYGITKTIFNKGKSYKVFAEELGGKDFISLNFYSTESDDLLKPCEMPEHKVIHFLQNVVIKDKS